MVNYVSPFTINNKMLEYVSSIMEKLGIKSKETFRANYFDPAIDSGLVKMTYPDKSTSKNQRYYKI